MASDVSLPTFSDEELLKYETLNALRDAILAKFTAGVASTDLSWPLIAEGDLDMGSYNLLGAQKIWNMVNAAEYADLASAISAAGSGGVVYIPADTTVTVAGGDSIIGNGATILGAGPSSVIKFTASPSGAHLIQLSGGTEMMVANLTLDGNTAAGSAKIGLDISGVTRGLVSRVWFKNFSGPALKASTGCNGLMISDCHFYGGSQEHIYVTESGPLGLVNIVSTSAGGIGIRLESSANAPIKVSASNVNVVSAAGNAIHFTGANAPGSSSASEFVGSILFVSGNVAGDAITLGDAAAALQRVVLSATTIQGAASRGLVVNASTGNISGIVVDAPATTCVDLDISQYTRVSDCTLRDGTIGIDGSDVGSGCVASNNTIYNCTTEVSPGANLVHYGNGSTISPSSANIYANLTEYVHPADGAAHVGNTITIPANTLRAGSTLRFTAEVDTSGAVFTSGMFVNFDGNGVGVGTLRGNSQETVIQGVLIFDSSTTCKSVYGDHCEDSLIATQAGIIVVTGLDLTKDNDVEISFTIPSGSGGTSKALILELGQGSVV